MNPILKEKKQRAERLCKQKPGNLGSSGRSACSQSHFCSVIWSLITGSGRILALHPSNLAVVHRRDFKQLKLRIAIQPLTCCLYFPFQEIARLLMAEEKKAFKKGKEREKSSFEKKRHDQDWRVCQASGGLPSEIL